MSDQRLPGGDGDGGRRESGTSRRSSNGELQQQQGQQLAQFLLAQMAQQQQQQQPGGTVSNVSPHPPAAVAAVQTGAGVPVFAPANAATAMAPVMAQDMAAMVQAMANEQAHAQVMEAAQRQVDLKTQELQQQVQIQQREIKRKKRAIEEQARVVQQQQARTAQIQMQHHYYQHPGGVACSVLDSSGIPLHPPSAGAVEIGARKSEPVPQGAIANTAATAATFMEGNPPMMMPMVPPIPAIPPVQKHQPQPTMTVIHPPLMQHITDAAVPGVSLADQAAASSQQILDQLEAQKKQLKEVLRKKEEEIAQRQAQEIVQSTKHTGVAPLSDVIASDISKTEKDSFNSVKEEETQKDREKSAKNREAKKRKQRKMMSQKKEKGRKRSDKETIKSVVRDTSSETVGAALPISENFVSADANSKDAAEAPAMVPTVPAGTAAASIQELPKKMEPPKQHSAKEAKIRSDGEAVPKKTPPKGATNAKVHKPGSKLKLRKRSRPKEEKSAGPALIEASIVDVHSHRVSNQMILEETKESAIPVPSPSRRTSKRKAIEVAKEGNPGDEKEEKKALTVPMANDFLCGGSKVSKSHPGNASFRILCESKAQAYHDGDLKEKQKIVGDLIKEVHSRDPPGRFLSSNDGNGEKWYIVSGNDLSKKINQKLRDIMRRDKLPPLSGGGVTDVISQEREVGRVMGCRSKQNERCNESTPQISRTRKAAASGREHNSNASAETKTNDVDGPSSTAASSPSNSLDSDEERYDLSNSFSFLRYSINSCQRITLEEKVASKSQKKRKRGKEEMLVDMESLIFYPEAPLGQIWRDIVDKKGGDGVAAPWKVGLERPPPLDAGGTVLGRPWVWDEGNYADESSASTRHLRKQHEELQDMAGGEDISLKVLLETMIDDQSDERGLPTAYSSMNDTTTDDNATSSSKSSYVPLHLRAYCLCGADHGARSNDVADGKVTTVAMPISGATPATSARKRRSDRQGSSVSLSNVLGELARGELNPHTLISCESYKGGPELRFLHDDDFAEDYIAASSLPSMPTTPAASMPHDGNDRHSLSGLLKGSRLQLDQVQPFSIKVCPDAMLLADLQSHLSESEIIGFLGGRYVESERCIYVQAAFPCKSTKRNDQGFTDVEMDPVSQIIAGETIAKHGLEVVGWYHSHPSFQPDPSVTDIHNQGNYQQLFGDHGHAVQVQETDEKKAIPFVGLIVGTYDTKNPTSESVMRWFHVTPKETGNVTSSGNASSSKRALGRGSSFVGAPSLSTERGWLKERVYFPMNLQVNHRQFRQFADVTGTDGIGGDDIAQARQALPVMGSAVRRKTDAKRFLCALSRQQGSSLSPVNDAVVSSPPMYCQPVQPQSERNEIASASRIKLMKRLENTDKDPPLLASDAKCVKGEPPFLLQNILPDAESSSSMDYAHPLLFNDRELSILRLVKEGDGAGDSIHAGVIWHAVEREQLAFVEDDSDIQCTIKPSQLPTSSSLILDLLLKLPNAGTADKESAINESPQDLMQDDAVLVHAIDVILSHYSTDSQRIDPFGVWNGSSDKGQVDTKIFRDLFRGDEVNDCPNDLEQYYLETVLGMSPGGGDSIGGKMRRGQKICVCLLKWSRRMPLLPYQWPEVGSSNNDKDPTWDHEPSIPHRKPHIFFVAEIMRLLAARWREADAAGLSSRRRRRIRHRPSSGAPIIDRKSPTEIESADNDCQIQSKRVQEEEKAPKVDNGDQLSEKHISSEEVEKTVQDEFMSI